ncbi:hypothetical protein [Bernardetia sp. MNP-M8]|uniref:hypothetical protein n=1 Tax=Bernardetia sp. MNP-M8 TaxID=3127470 RepID=UPI0030CD4284
MAGNYDRIYGYNQVYRNAAGAPNFYSFNFNAQNRPTAFIYRFVNVVNGQDVYDHQGHIVPQQMLNLVLDDVMANMAMACNNLTDVIQFIQDHQAQSPWLMSVWCYANAANIPYNILFDFDENDPEDKLGGFFSIITWNPVNICRAPTDDHRGGVPGNNIDVQVVDYLTQNPQGVDPQWIVAVNALNNGDINTNQYITACSNTLAMQAVQGTGYYAFPWKTQENVLIPQ